MNKKTIGLGISDFKEIIEENHYLIDKSLFIKDVINDGAKVTLLPRPRRWGKTLNMSMLKYFLEKTETSHRKLFAGLAVEQHPEVMAHQGKYPVIFLTFKDAKKESWTETWSIIKELLIREHKRHKYLIESEILDQQEKDDFYALLMGNASQHAFESSLKNLSIYLHRFHTVAPFILIDEYDAPIHAGFTHHFYDQAINFMRSFLSMALKDNVHLKKGILTGILRVTKESIFSGLNNIKVCTLLSNVYAEYFGFTEAEVAAFLAYYDASDKLDQVRAWYNGYQVGEKTTLYNPWSVLNYIDQQKKLAPYWMNTSNNLLIKEIIQKNPASFKEDLEQLMLGNIVEKELVEFVTFDSLFSKPNDAFNFLLLTGYLSFNKRELRGIREYFSLNIPNEKVRLYYQTTIMQWIQESLDLATYQNMLKDLTSGDFESFKEVFERTVERSLSSFDVADDEPEKFYHMFVLGMLVCLQDSHQVLSNRDSGTGRYDVMIIPKDTNKIGVIIEFKRTKTTDEALELGVAAAFAQIKAKRYQAELEARGITQIINVAIAFAGKRVLVKYE